MPVLLAALKKYYGRARCSLDYTNPLQLAVATILSAQCTDRQVNRVTPALFRKYPTPLEYLQAPIQELETDIRSMRDMLFDAFQRGRSD